MAAHAEMFVIKHNRERRERLDGQRERRQRMVHLADLLPEAERTFLRAHFDRGLTVRELAQLHGTTPRQTRRRLERLCEMLADPLFLLVRRYRNRLPGEFPALARRHWLEGVGLRELARERRQSLHRTRQEIDSIRAMLMAFARATGSAAPPAEEEENITSADE